MYIEYNNGSPSEILSAIKEQLGGRKLGKILSFKLEGDDLAVTIKKMGTSYLNFKSVGNGEGIRWELEKEKIALTHKTFRKEMIDKLSKAIAQTGGNLNADAS